MSSFVESKTFFKSVDDDIVYDDGADDDDDDGADDDYDGDGVILKSYSYYCMYH
jgi:hypothetical protein